MRFFRIIRICVRPPASLYACACPDPG
jgi:hypothetical protein